MSNHGNACFHKHAKRHPNSVPNQSTREPDQCSPDSMPSDTTSTPIPDNGASDISRQRRCVSFTSYCTNLLSFRISYRETHRKTNRCSDGEAHRQPDSITNRNANVFTNWNSQTASDTRSNISTHAKANASPD